MHAGLIGKNMIERFSRIPVTVDIASEFRYQDPILDSSTLVITISQSGETADTLAALRLAKENGINNILEGSNIDDIGDYRPGLKAIKELEVLSPLQTVGLTKTEIRILSKELGLNTWDKPSKACLASRFVYGEEITVEKLEMIEQAEQLLTDLGYVQSRVRIHGNIARIEVLEEQIERFVQKHKEVVSKKFKDLGFLYVVLDLEGYRTGSMNEVLKNK